jgi:hypothetical protein
MSSVARSRSPRRSPPKGGQFVLRAKARHRNPYGSMLSSIECTSTASISCKLAPNLEIARPAISGHSPFLMYFAPGNGHAPHHLGTRNICSKSSAHYAINLDSLPCGIVSEARLGALTAGIAAPAIIAKARGRHPPRGLIGGRSRAEKTAL